MENNTPSGSSEPSFGDQPPLQLGMLIYPGMTLLDFAGPQAALGMHGQTHVLWKTLDPVLSDTGISVLPTCTFADCPAELDILFVPGGFGTTAMMEDREVLDFLALHGKTARYVTSVCTGSAILGAAGLLDGYKAATHWSFYEALEALGVEAVHSRVVVDRNRFTGGGVTAGLDFGLTLLAELRGETVAQMTQLMLEYDPKPPFQTGTPETAGPELTAMTTAILGAGPSQGTEIAKAVRRRRMEAAS